MREAWEKGPWEFNIGTFYTEVVLQVHFEANYSPTKLFGQGLGTRLVVWDACGFKVATMPYSVAKGHSLLMPPHCSREESGTETTSLSHMVMRAIAMWLYLIKSSYELIANYTLIVLPSSPSIPVIEVLAEQVCHHTNRRFGMQVVEAQEGQNNPGIP